MCFIFSFYRSNYVGFTASLNVLRVDDLINDLYLVYRGDPEYGFCSLDVVSMFDRLSMDLVKKAIFLLDMRIGKECVVSRSRLLELVDVDAKILNVFRYVSPTIPSSPATYVHQCKGIFMGGNTSTAYADIYMSVCVSHMQAELESLGVLLLRKYVDDFLLYLPKRNFAAVLELFQRVTQLDFTIEEPVNGRLPYLDVMLNDVAGELTTTWYVLVYPFQHSMYKLLVFQVSQAYKFQPTHQFP